MISGDTWKSIIINTSSDESKTRRTKGDVKIKRGEMSCQCNKIPSRDSPAAPSEEVSNFVANMHVVVYSGRHISSFEAIHLSPRHANAREAGDELAEIRR